MIVTAAEMKNYDRRASEEFGIPALILMENAGKGLAEMALRRGDSSKILVVCGKGNNGGDGFVAARHLINRRRDVTVALAADPEKLKGNSLINYAILKKQVPVSFLKAGELESFEPLIRRQDIVIDALFGIGLNAPVKAPEFEIIQKINSAGSHIIAADIPSGIQADSGAVLGIAVMAHQTASFGFLKRGLTCGEGPRHAGGIEIIDISLPRAFLDEKTSKEDFL